jgi:hypothetical protein
MGGGTWDHGTYLPHHSCSQPLEDTLYIPSYTGQQTFSLKGLIVNILGIVSQDAKLTRFYPRED